MILNWKGDGFLTVMPLDIEKFKKLDLIEDENVKSKKAGELSIGIKPVVIAPGWNEVEDSIWFLCRPHLENMFKLGKIEEMAREEKDENGNRIYVGLKITDFKNRQGAVFGPDKLVEIIRGCYSLATLEKWKLEEARDEIRLEIKNQIDKMNTPEKAE